MCIRPVLAACLVLVSAGASRADDAAPQEVRRLREEIATLRQQLAEKTKLLEATIRVGEQRQGAVLELRQALEKAQKENLRLLAQKNEERRKRIQAEITSKTLQDRSLKLEEEVRQVARELARVRLGGGGVTLKRRGENPPPGDIQGKITAVDKDSRLFRISVGSDAGLKTGHTLEVVRLATKPQESKYVGRVEVIAVRPADAVVRFVSRPAVPAEAGDQVMSRLPGQQKK